MSPLNSQTNAEEVANAFSSNVRGRAFLITGASEKGLGATAAITLAGQAPDQIILVARNKAKVESVIRDIHKAGPTIKVKFVTCELSDLDSVRKAADEIISDSDIPKIDVIINNAGVMNIKEYTLDKAGYEMTLSANHIGHFLLTNLIIPKILAAGKGARVVSVSSSGHQVSSFRFNDYNFSDGKTYDGWSAYGQSKTANILFTVELARRLADRGINAYSVHPGVIFGTGLASHLDWDDFKDIGDIAMKNTGRPIQLDDRKTLSQGTASLLAATLDPALDDKSGAFVQNCQAGETYDYASDKDNAKKLWELSEKLVGQKFNF